MYRRVWALCLLYALSLQSTARAQDAVSPLVISERVGAEIDQNERTYFGLFPRIDGFLSATARALTDSTVVFTVTQQQHDRRQDTLLVYKREVIDELSRYVDHFERVYRDADAVEWGWLLQMARPVKPFRRGIPLAITTWDDTRVQGWLLHIDEQVLVLSKDGLAESLVHPEEAILLFPHEIKHVRDQWPLFKRLVGEINIPGAGREDIYRAYTLRRLHAHAALQTAPSPELRRFIEEKLTELQHRSPEIIPPFPVDKALLYRLSTRIHLFLNMPLLSAPRELQSYTVETTFQTPQQRPAFFPGSSFSFRIGYSLTRRLSLYAGLHYLNQPTLKEPPRNAVIGGREEVVTATCLREALDLGYVDFSGFFASSLFTYSVKPFDLLAYLWGQSHLILKFTEVRIGAGPSLAFLSTEAGLRSGAIVRFPPTYSPSCVRIGTTSTYQQRTLGAATLAEMDVYLSRFFSVGGTVQVSFYPEVQVRNLELQDELGGSSGDKRLHGFKQEVVLVDTFLGLRFHL